MEVDQAHGPTVGDAVPICPLVLDEPGRVGLLAAELVANRLRARPGMRIALPTGRTPVGMYAALRAHAAAGQVSASHAVAFSARRVRGARAS